MEGLGQYHLWYLMISDNKTCGRYFRAFFRSAAFQYHYPLLTVWSLLLTIVVPTVLFFQGLFQVSVYSYTKYLSLAVESGRIVLPLFK